MKAKTLAAAKRARKKAKFSAGGDKDGKDAGSDGESGSDEGSEDDEDEDDDDDDEIPEPRGAQRHPATGEAARVGTPAELKERLQAKLLALKGGRKDMDDTVQALLFHIGYFFMYVPMEQVIISCIPYGCGMFFFSMRKCD